MKKAVFLDRDGTLLVERGGPPIDPADVALLPGAVAGLRTLRDAGFLLVVVTNQSGLARGLYDEATYRAVTARMTELLAAGGVTLEGVLHCPHHPEWSGPCDCRKPAPGLILTAVEQFGIDGKRSWVVGDAARDLEAGLAAGCRVILVRTGKGESQREAAANLRPRPAVVADLVAAARQILTEGEDA